MTLLAFNRSGARFQLGGSCSCASVIAVLANLLPLGAPVMAQNTCGVPVAGEVICWDSSLNAYESGISYTASGELKLRLQAGIVADRTDAAQNGSAIFVDGLGSDPLSLVLDPDVAIYTNKIYNDGLRISNSGGSVTVNSAANIFVNFPEPNLNPLVATGGIFGNIHSATGQGVIQILHQSGASIFVAGESSVGIYALHDGMGSASVDVGGRISNSGYYSMGALGTLANAASSATLTMNLRAGSEIHASGNESVAIYGLNNGLGGVTQRIAGSIYAIGSEVDGSIAYSNNALATGRVIHSIERTARIEIEGADSSAAFTLHKGLGATVTSLAGHLLVAGSKANGLNLLVERPDNIETHSISLSDGGSIAATGNGARGILAERYLGSGQLDIALTGASGIEVAGDRAAGISVAAPNAGHVAVSLDATSFLASAGDDGRAIVIEGGNAIHMRNGGRISAIGQYGVGIEAVSSNGATHVAVEQMASVVGGWQTEHFAGRAGPDRPAAAIVAGSLAGTVVTNAGLVTSASDLAIFDAGRQGAPVGSLTIHNSGTIVGHVQYASGADNLFANEAGGLFQTRYFADIDGSGTRTVKYVAISDFGDGASSGFANAGRIRFGNTEGAAVADGTAYYRPTTGVDQRPLSPQIYTAGNLALSQAQFTNLGQFRHSGVIDLRGPAVGNTLVMTANGAADGAGGSGLFISDGGALLLKAKLNAGLAPGGQTGSQADMLILDGTRLGTGATKIFVDFDSAISGAYTPGNGIQLVEVRNKTASEPGVFMLGNEVVAGAFQYLLYQNGVGEDATDGNWYLRNSRIDPDHGTEHPNYRTDAPVLMAPQSLASRLGLEMLGTYHDRHGEDYADWIPRHADQAAMPGRKISMWSRIFGIDGSAGSNKGSISTQASRFQRQGASYDYGTIGMQMGLDLLRTTNAQGGRNILGLYGGYGEIDADVDAVYGGRPGRVRLEGYSAGLYYTHKANSGAYVDALLQAMRYNAKASSAQIGYLRTHGWGYAASLEAGRPLVLGSGWKLEPQAQIIYQHGQLDSVTDGITTVDYRAQHGLWGRIGARLAKNWGRQSGLSNMAWVRFNLWHDFDRQAQTQFGNADGFDMVPLASSMGGTFGQAQFALSSEMDRNVSGFASADYRFSMHGPDGHSYGGRVGLRFVW